MSEKRLLLEEAIGLVCNDRNNTYGPPHADFSRTAAMWTVLLGDLLRDDAKLKPHHVAMMMIALKLSRLTWSEGKRDSWTDAAGYAAAGWECVVEEARP